MIHNFVISYFELLLSEKLQLVKEVKQKGGDEENEKEHIEGWEVEKIRLVAKKEKTETKTKTKRSRK